jgi:hypothetical protein
LPRIQTSAEGFSFFAGCALGARRAKTEQGANSSDGKKRKS